LRVFAMQSLAKTLSLPLLWAQFRDFPAALPARLKCFRARGMVGTSQNNQLGTRG
jgi:hypothetical protein